MQTFPTGTTEAEVTTWLKSHQNKHAWAEKRFMSSIKQRYKHTYCLSCEWTPLITHMNTVHRVQELWCTCNILIFSVSPAYIPLKNYYYFEWTLKYPRGESTRLRCSACYGFIHNVVSVQLIFELLSTRKDNPSWRALFIRLSSYFSIKTYLHPPHPLCSTVFNTHQIHWAELHSLM